jgi:hypothetical protein
VRWPVVGDDGVVFHLMRRVLQRHGAHWSAALPEMTKTQWAVLRVVASEEHCDHGERHTVVEEAPVDVGVRILAHGEPHTGIGTRQAAQRAGEEGGSQARGREERDAALVQAARGTHRRTGPISPRMLPDPPIRRPR